MSGGQYKMPPAIRQMSANLARIMVRRYLRSWIDAGTFDEGFVTQVFYDCMMQYPSANYATIRAIADQRLRMIHEQGIDYVPSHLILVGDLTTGGPEDGEQD
jgi:hypothetical protein